MEKFLQIRQTLIRIVHPNSFFARNKSVSSDISQLNTLNSGVISSYQFSVDDGETYTDVTNQHIFSGLIANMQYRIRVREKYRI